MKMTLSVCEFLNLLFLVDEFWRRRQPQEFYRLGHLRRDAKGVVRVSVKFELEILVIVVVGHVSCCDDQVEFYIVEQGFPNDFIADGFFTGREGRRPKQISPLSFRENGIGRLENLHVVMFG